MRTEGSSIVISVGMLPTTYILQSWRLTGTTCRLVAGTSPRHDIVSLGRRRHMNCRLSNEVSLRLRVVHDTLCLRALGHHTLTIVVTSTQYYGDAVHSACGVVSVPQSSPKATPFAQCLAFCTGPYSDHFP